MFFEEAPGIPNTFYPSTKSFPDILLLFHKLITKVLQIDSLESFTLTTLCTQ